MPWKVTALCLKAGLGNLYRGRAGYGKSSVTAGRARGVARNFCNGGKNFNPPQAPTFSACRRKFSKFGFILLHFKAILPIKNYIIIFFILFIILLIFLPSRRAIKFRSAGHMWPAGRRLHRPVLNHSKSVFLNKISARRDTVQR